MRILWPMMFKPSLFMRSMILDKHLAEVHETKMAVWIFCNRTHSSELLATHLPRWVLDSPFSVGTRQSSQILDFYNNL